MIFETQYGFRHDLVGLSFLGIGAGQFLGQFFYSWIATKSFNKAKAKGEVEPEQRLGPMMIGAVVIPVGLFWYGWAVEFKSQWMSSACSHCSILSWTLIYFREYKLPTVQRYQTLTTNPDASEHVLGRRVHRPRRIRDGS